MLLNDQDCLNNYDLLNDTITSYVNLCVDSVTKGNQDLPSQTALYKGTGTYMEKPLCGLTQNMKGQKQVHRKHDQKGPDRLDKVRNKMRTGSCKRCLEGIEENDEQAAVNVMTP